jgi:uncharacterized Zn finger protein
MEGVPSNLTGAINEAVIRRLADAQSYQRGLDYYSHGHVESLEDRDESVRSVVRGNHDYTVTLAADEGVLDYSCDCPVGSDGTFCKHCVATALAWLNRAVTPARSSGRGKAKEVTLADAGPRRGVHTPHGSFAREVQDQAQLHQAGRAEAEVAVPFVGYASA